MSTARAGATTCARPLTRCPGLVPVAKGNGYGFGVGGSPARPTGSAPTRSRSAPTPRCADVEQRFSGDILVLEPWRPFLPTSPYADRIVHTVGRAEDLAALADRRRHAAGRARGADLDAAGTASPPTTCARLPRGARGRPGRGHALHLPLGDGHVDEVERWLAARRPQRRWFVSHLTDGRARSSSRGRHPEAPFRPRVGTALWLGDRSALSARATVLDAHPVAGATAPATGSAGSAGPARCSSCRGGTAHGIAPRGTRRPRRRPASGPSSVAKGGLEAAGRALSPFVSAGKQRWFVEPPHMQVAWSSSRPRSRARRRRRGRRPGPLHHDARSTSVVSAERRSA